MNETSLRNFFEGTISGGTLNHELEAAADHVGASCERYSVTDLDSDFVVTRNHAIRLVEEAAAGALSPQNLSRAAFLVIASDRLSFPEDDDLIRSVFHLWAAPEINWRLSPPNLAWFRRVLAEEVPLSSTPPDIEDPSLGEAASRMERRPVKSPSEESGA